MFKFGTKSTRKKNFEFLFFLKQNPNPKRENMVPKP